MTRRHVFDGQRVGGAKILEFDLSGIQAGIYIFEAYENKLALQKRFIKE